MVTGAWGRTLVPGVVIACLLYAQGGYQLRYEAQRKAVQRGIKDRIRNGLPKDMLTRFTMTEDEWKALDWVKPEREFRLPNGDMYDVVRATLEHGQVDAWCIHDRAESHLFAGLREFVQRTVDGPAKEGGRKRVTSFTSTLYPPSGRGGHMLLPVVPFARPCANGRSRPGHPMRGHPPPERA